MRERAYVGEYESEPVPGLPGALPEGETVLWQGAPDWRQLARRSFHTWKVAAYFALLIVWSLGAAIAESQPVSAAAASAGGLTLLAGCALGILSFLAWLVARAAVYTITDRRVVIRAGVALQVAVNLPFQGILAADLRSYGDGAGDISLTVSDSGRLGYAMLWPFARPWHFGRSTRPMLRAVPDADAVARTLTRALVAAANHADADCASAEGDVGPSLATVAA